MLLLFCHFFFSRGFHAGVESRQIPVSLIFGYPLSIT
jgi:hypothetical protein